MGIRLEEGKYIKIEEIKSDFARGSVYYVNYLSPTTSTWWVEGGIWAACPGESDLIAEYREPAPLFWERPSVPATFSSYSA